MNNCVLLDWILNRWSCKLKPLKPDFIPKHWIWDPDTTIWCFSIHSSSEGCLWLHFISGDFLGNYFLIEELSFVSRMLINSACVSPGTEGMWAFSQDLTAILVKQEPNLLSEPSPGPAPTMPTSSSATQPITLNPPPQKRHNHDKVRAKTLYWSLHTRAFTQTEGCRVSMLCSGALWDSTYCIFCTRSCKQCLLVWLWQIMLCGLLKEGSEKEKTSQRNFHFEEKHLINVSDL